MNDESPLEKPQLPDEVPDKTSAEDMVESSMELAPGWWEVLLEELDRLPAEIQEPSALELMMAAENEPPIDVASELDAFPFDAEQIPESLWDLAPGLRIIADHEPKIELPPIRDADAEEELSKILPPAEDFRPIDMIPDEPEALKGENPALEAGEGFDDDIRSIWEVVPSWWHVYTEEPQKPDEPERNALDAEPEEITDEWVSAIPLVDEFPDPGEAESLWDYAPDLKDRLSTVDEGTPALPPGGDEIPVWNLEGGGEEEPRFILEASEDETAEAPALLSEAFYPEDEISLLPDPNVGIDITPKTDDEALVTDEPDSESVWEAVPSWWQVYATNIEEESEREEENRLSYFDYESLTEEEGPLPIPVEDSERINLSDELVKYIEETQERIEAAEQQSALVEEELEELPIVTTPVIAGDTEIPEDLQDELEKEKGARPRYATLPFVLASVAVIVAIVSLMWLGGGALVRALVRQPAAERTPAAQLTPTQAYPGTLGAMPSGPYDVNAKPVGLELKTGVVFSLKEGVIEQGRWQPTSPEWLPGADLVKVVAIPWKEDYQSLVDSLKPGDKARLAMSNWVVEEYQIREIFLAPREKTDFLSGRKLSLAVIFSRTDDAERWVILLDRTQ